MVLLTPNLSESFPRHLRDEAMQEIERRGLGVDELAEILNIFPAGAERILRDEKWSAERGIRVIGALGLDITVNPISPSSSPENFAS